MMAHDHADQLDVSRVRGELDEILAKEITSFIEMDTDIALMSYNLANISCILIAVEREREIKSFADSPPERFTRKSLIRELVEIGLEEDDALIEAVDSVIQMGYLSTNFNQELVAEVPAYTMVGFLDNMFPGMQGMNLIAFVMQMNDEVVSGRKSLEQAKKNFAQTLKSRGVAVTKEKVEAKAADPAMEMSFKESKEVAEKLKAASAKRLANLRRKRSDRKPSFYSSDGSASEKATVKDLFDKGPSKEELAAREAAKAEAENEARKAQLRAEELAQREEKVKEAEAAAREAEKRARELEIREQELAVAEEAARSAREKEQALKEREEKMAAREAELKAMEERLKAAEEERLRRESQAAEKDDKQSNRQEQESPEDIEARIAAFEAELAMACPVCNGGKVVSEQTPAGKAYYTCSNSECRFVSWDQPYHFPCPMCKNPYLVEMNTAQGKGLKCPRASCSYSQDNLLDPVQNAAAANQPPKKKKKVVRRVKKKR
ncbi:MAG TPA: DNA topoisomerase I [Desulfobacteraceae bacterium]|nr:DNA topoisomerase I [Desulfobacteraceae bacterium]